MTRFRGLSKTFSLLRASSIGQVIYFIRTSENGLFKKYVTWKGGKEERDQ